MPSPIAPFEALIIAMVILRNHPPEFAAAMTVVRPRWGSRSTKRQCPRQDGYPHMHCLHAHTSTTGLCADHTAAVCEADGHGPQGTLLSRIHRP
jgi:hypothetical protein